MDFFARQEEARRRTRYLVVYFAAAVLLIIAAVYLVLAVLLMRSHEPVAWVAGIIHPPLLLGVAATVGLLIGAGTLYKVIELSRPGSGERLAQVMGGRQINPSTTDPAERRLLNVVEEMAIASGTAVPPVYLLPEESINAFAAGLNPASAVVALTEGALRRLRRDELQGVIGHEFSHILYGDMRLNVRLLGVLHGILVVALTGTYLLRSLGRGGARLRGGSRKGGGGVLVLLVIGLSLAVVGYAGRFMAQLIQRAVSRQREYLADAASVQFTRDPAGIARALVKIGRSEGAGRLGSERTAEMGHFLFADGVRRFLGGLMSTHPPLPERIRRIDPYLSRELEAGPEPGEESAGAAPAAVAVPSSVAVRPVQALASGPPGPPHLEYATAVMEGLPAPVAAAARDPFTARALVYLLLLDPRPEVRAAQTEQLAQSRERAAAAETARLAAAVNQLSPEQRLPLVSLCMPSLWQLSPAQRRDFLDQVDGLVLADRRVSLFEFCLRRLVRRPGQVGAGEARPRPALAAGGAASRLLSALAQAGAPDESSRAAAFDRGRQSLPRVRDLVAVPEAQLTAEALDEALDVLAAEPPRRRRELLDACLACAGADGRIGLAESEWVRAIADSLSCPLPPLVAGPA